MLFAESEIVSVPVDLIGIDHSWVMSMTLLESFQRILECNAFIESVKAKIFHEGESIDYADRKLGTKLNGGILDAANDCSYKTHVQADDPIRDTVLFLLIHLKLLPVKLLIN